MGYRYKDTQLGIDYVSRKCVSLRYKTTVATRYVGGEVKVYADTNHTYLSQGAIACIEAVANMSEETLVNLIGMHYFENGEY